MYFVNNSNDVSKPNIASQNNNIQNSWDNKPVEVKENNNIQNDNTVVLQIDQNKTKIQKTVEWFVNNLKKDGIAWTVVKYKWDIFIPLPILLNFYASTPKTKNNVKMVVQKIMNEDPEMKNIKAVYIMFKPYVTDNLLQTTCEQNHASEMDCNNIKALKKNNLLIEETKTMLSHKLWYFKQLWVILIIDGQTYTILNDSEWKPLNINTL